MGQFKEYLMLGQARIKLGQYTSEKPFIFTNTVPAYFDGTTIPTGTEIKFFESRNFGFVTFHENGRIRILKE